MKNFDQFATEAKPEIERVTLEMAEYYGKLKYPIECYFIVTIDTYAPSGVLLDRSTDSKPVQEMEEVLQNAERYEWSIDFDKANNVFTIKKTFDNGQFRVATYTPYDKTAFTINFEP